MTEDHATALEPGRSQAGAAHRIEVVVVTWNSAGLLDGLLSSLPAGLAGVDWRLTVVDNASADETVALAERRLREHGSQTPGRVVQTGRNAGYAAAINIGLAGAEPYTAALILNPDVRLEADGVRHMLEVLDAPASALPPAGIVVPRILEPDGSLFHSLRRDPSIVRAMGDAVLGRRAGRFARLGEIIADDRAYATTTTAAWAGGAAMLISEACLTACGPWDESFFLYSEETEFALRARDRGFATRLAPRAAVTHIGGESATSERLWALLTVNRVRLYRRRHSRASTLLYWGAVLLRESLRAALGRRTNRRAVAALLRLRPVLPAT